MDWFSYVGFPLRLIVVSLSIVFVALLLSFGAKVAVGKMPGVEEKKKKTITKWIHDALVYASLLGLVLYLLSPFFDVSKVLAGVGVATVLIGIAAQHTLKDIFVGCTRLMDRQIFCGDFVRINGMHEGVVEAMGIRSLSLRQWDGHVLMMAHGDIKEIQNGTKEHRRVIERVVLTYRQSPKEAWKVLEEVADTCNDRLDHYLFRQQDGTPLEPFRVHGITNLNAQFHGVEYAVTAMVNAQDVVQASLDVRKTLAIACYEHNLKMAETNVFYRTRLNTNSEPRKN